MTMTTTLLILILVIIALLSGVLVVLLLYNQRKLLDKNDAIVREIRENMKLRTELRDALRHSHEAKSTHEI